jgi:hypothetical protein
MVSSFRNCGVRGVSTERHVPIDRQRILDSTGMVIQVRTLRIELMSSAGCPWVAENRRSCFSKFMLYLPELVIKNKRTDI